MSKNPLPIRSIVYGGGIRFSIHSHRVILSFGRAGYCLQSDLLERVMVRDHRLTIQAEYYNTSAIAVNRLFIYFNQVIPVYFYKEAADIRTGRKVIESPF